MQEKSVILGKTVDVDFNGDVLTLHKLPLGRLDALGKAYAGLVGVPSEPFSGSGTEEVTDQIDKVYSKSPQKIAELAAVLTGLDVKTFLEAPDPDEVLEIIEKGCALNNVTGLFQNAIKKALGTVKAQPAPQA